MYNLKIEAVKIIETLEANGYKACFIGNYPFVKFHNTCHQDDKLKVKQIEMVTDAKLDDLQKLFKVVKINDQDYVKSVTIELEVKQNKVYFKIFYATEYSSVVSGKVKQVNTIEEILDNCSFLIETLTMDKDSNLSNYVSKKMDAYQSIREKVLHSNGNFRERVLENPLIMLELCYYVSNISYQVNESMLKIISNNCQYLKYESMENITRYFSMILTSKNPIIGIKIIKNTMLDFKYNDVKIFEFLQNISDEYLWELSKFGGSIDVISRWAYLLRLLPKNEYDMILNNFNLSYKNKIVWLLQNFNLVEEEDHKTAIYNSRETLKQITESKWDVFLLFEMFDKLTKIHCALDPEKEDKCKKIIDTICSRPFFTYQILYNDDELCKIANVESGPWLELAKENLIQKIIACNKHPEEDKYLEMTKESIEFGLISSL